MVTLLPMNSHERRTNHPDGEPVHIEIVYMFLLDHEGNEEAGVPIRLQSDGSIDLSLVPAGIRDTWNEIGVRTASIGDERVFPRHGKRFLEVLLREGTNIYRRFRMDPAQIANGV